MTLGIIGMGLIGGSMALDLLRGGFADAVLGVEQDSAAAAAAQRIGLCSEVVSLDECVDRSDIVIVSVPVSAAPKVLREVLDRFQATGATDKIAIDVCSTKESICAAVKYHPCRTQYVATHPMAGTEYSGPWAAQPGIFDAKACIFADAEESSPKALRAVEDMYSALNMRIIRMSADAHDVHAAYVSHLSHIISFALALTVLDKEKDDKHIFDLASGGFSSTVRLAKSGAPMWVPILMQNRENLLRVMDTYMDFMESFKDALESYDEDAVRELVEGANKIRKIIR